MNTLALEGQWSLTALDRDIVQHHCPQLAEKAISFSLPNDIHSILLEKGLIEDPYKGQNAARSAFINQTGWLMSNTFTYKAKKGERTILALSSVDTFATVRVNGKKLGALDNAFTRYLFDVTNELKDGENTIEIAFENFNRRMDELEMANPDVPRPALVRKTARHFGPYSITPVGIYEPVRLVSDDCLVVTSWNCMPRLVDHNWIMKVEIAARVFREADVDFNAAVADRREHTIIHVAPGKENYSFTFTIPEEDVAIWEPAGMGGQHLYPMDISFANHSDKRMIAFRTIRLENSEDQWGRSFRLIVNEKEVFIKGIAWTGLDILPSRNNASRTIHALQSAAQVGLNAVRVHCSSAYESEVFYDSCDRLGLLVWQDLMFAEAKYPTSESFERSVEGELVYQIQRLKSHPCLALFSAGGALAIWKERKMGDIIAYDRLNHGLVERMVKTLSPTSIYVPHSGIERIDSTVREHMSPLYGLSFTKDGANLVALRSEERPVPRFASSISFPSIPSLSTVSAYCTDGELNIATDSMMKHQSGVGSFELIVSAILESYRFPDSLEKMIYLSQISQADVIAKLVDWYRSQGAKCAGLFIKSLSSSYPAADESAIEYSGKWKMLMYQLRTLFAPITTICLRRDGKITIYAQNDSGEETEVKVSLKFSSFNGDKLRMQVYRKVLPAHTMVRVCSTDYAFIKDTSEAFAYVKVSTPKIYREDLVLLDEPKRCHFADPKLNVKVTKSGRNFLCEVSCTHPAFQVVLDAGDIRGNFSENLFSIRPTAQKVVTFTPEQQVSLEDFKKSLKTRDLYWASN